MKTSKERVDEIKRQSQILDFSDTFNLAFEVYKKVALHGGLVIIIFVIIMVIVFAALFGSIFGFGSLSASMVDFNIGNFSMVYVALYIIAMAAIAGLTYPFTAGLIKMAHNAHTNQEFSAGTAFEYYKGSLFGDLFFAGFILSLFISGFTTILEYLQIPLVGGILNIIFGILTILTIPLIIFADLKAVDAIGASFAIAARNFLWIALLMLVAVILAFVGAIAFCIGMFFTLPFVYTMYYSVYVHTVGIAENSELDQIGSEWD